MSRPPPLKGKTVLVTGASSGIGKATALLYAQKGAHLVLAARRMDRLEEVAREARSHGVKVKAVGCDVSHPDCGAQLAQVIQAEAGGLDVLINNAGLGLFGPLEKVSEAQLRQVFEVNLFGLVRLTRELLPLLRVRPGAAIVNVSSVLGHRALPLLGGYSASKAALNAISEAWRLELAPEGITVAVVSPGLTDSEFREARLSAQGYEQEAVPLKAMSAHKVAQVIVRAAQVGQRDAVLTLAGKAMVYGNRLSPALLDRVAGRWVGPPKAKR